ncbi:hypothetical protein Tco_0528671 [Tanacetum coccineum]
MHGESLTGASSDSRGYREDSTGKVPYKAAEQLTDSRRTSVSPDTRGAARETVRGSSAPRHTGASWLRTSGPAATGPDGQRRARGSMEVRGTARNATVLGRAAERDMDPAVVERREVRVTGKAVGSARLTRHGASRGKSSLRRKAPSSVRPGPNGRHEIAGSTQLPSVPTDGNAKVADRHSERRSTKSWKQSNVTAYGKMPGRSRQLVEKMSQAPTVPARLRESCRGGRETGRQEAPACRQCTKARVGGAGFRKSNVGVSRTVGGTRHADSLGESPRNTIWARAGEQEARDNRCQRKTMKDRSGPRAHARPERLTRGATGAREGPGRWFPTSNFQERSRRSAIGPGGPSGLRFQAIKHATD